MILEKKYSSLFSRITIKPDNRYAEPQRYGRSTVGQRNVMHGVEDTVTVTKRNKGLAQDMRFRRS